jgi:hypothetical protein
MKLGEWEKYCTNLDQNIPKTNRLLSWEYVVPGCNMRLMNAEDMIASMTKDGGWSIAGDSFAREVSPPVSLAQHSNMCLQYTIN